MYRMVAVQFQTILDNRTSRVRAENSIMGICIRLYCTQCGIAATKEE